MDHPHHLNSGRPLGFVLEMEDYYGSFHIVL